MKGCELRTTLRGWLSASTWDRTLRCCGTVIIGWATYTRATGMCSCGFIIGTGGRRCRSCCSCSCCCMLASPAKSRFHSLSRSSSAATSEDGAASRASWPLSSGSNCCRLPADSCCDPPGCRKAARASRTPPPSSRMPPSYRTPPPSSAPALRTTHTGCGRSR